MGRLHAKGRRHLGCARSAACRPPQQPARSSTPAPPPARGYLESRAVVADFKDQHLRKRRLVCHVLSCRKRFNAHDNLALAGLSMLNNIGERLLGDAIGCHLDGGGKLRQRRAALKGDLQGGTCLRQAAGKLGDGADSPNSSRVGGRKPLIGSRISATACWVCSPKTRASASAWSGWVWTSRAITSRVRVWSASRGPKPAGHAAAGGAPPRGRSPGARGLAQRHGRLGGVHGNARLARQVAQQAQVGRAEVGLTQAWGCQELPHFVTLVNEGQDRQRSARLRADPQAMGGVLSSTWCRRMAT